MISSFEVGAIFRLQDEAGAQLARLSEQVEGLNRLVQDTQASLASLGEERVGGLSRSVGNLASKLGDVGAASHEMRTAIVADLEAVNTGLMESVRRARELAAAMGEARGLGGTLAATASPAARNEGAEAAADATVIAAARSTGVAQGAEREAGLVRSGEGGGGSVHLRGYAPAAGPFHASFGAGAATVIGAAAAYGAYEEAQIEDMATRAALTMELPLGKDFFQSPTFTKLRATVLGTLASTGLPIHDIDEAGLTIVRQLGGMAPEKRLDVMPDILSYAATEARLKGVSLEEATQAIVGLVHESGKYEPEEIKALAGKIAYASTISPLSLEQMERAGSYAIPTLRAGLSMDPGELLLLQAEMQQAGVLSSKSGTWEESFFERLQMNTATISGLAQKKQIEGLRKLGLYEGGDPLTGEDAHATFLKADGSIDVVKVAEIMHAHAAQLPPTERMQAFSWAFGKQGERFAAQLSDEPFIARLPKLKAGMEDFHAGEDFLKDYGRTSPVQQTRQAIADFEKVLIDVGKDVLPGVTASLHTFDEVIKILGKDGVELATEFGLAALVLKKTGLLTSPPGSGAAPSLLTPPAAPGTPGGATAAPGAAQNLGLLGMLPLVGAIPYAKEIGDWAANELSDLVLGKMSPEQRKLQEEAESGGLSWWLHRLPGQLPFDNSDAANRYKIDPRPHIGVGAPHSEAAPAGALPAAPLIENAPEHPIQLPAFERPSMSPHEGEGAHGMLGHASYRPETGTAVAGNTFNLTFQVASGDPHAIAEAVMAALNDLMWKAEMHNTGNGVGTYGSRFASGANA